jgi:hypothetical protein
MDNWKIFQLSIGIGHMESNCIGIMYATEIHIVFCNVFFREYIGNITNSARTDLITSSTLAKIYICAKTFIGEGGA